MRQTFVRATLIVTLVCSVHAGTAHGQSVIYDNGEPNHTDSSNISYFTGAEDFTLSSNQTITAVRAWLYGNSGYAGSVAWAIYSDSSSHSPGGVLASGNSAATF